jgi:hypothetical protein
MKSLILIATLVAATAFAPGTNAHPYGYGIETRQQRQAHRIAQGYRHGELTRCEATRLSSRAWRIERREHAYRASGGLGPIERRDLNARLDSLSRDIYEQRRDGAGCW